MQRLLSFFVRSQDTYIGHSGIYREVFCCIMSLNLHEGDDNNNISKACNSSSGPIPGLNYDRIGNNLLYCAVLC